MSAAHSLSAEFVDLSAHCFDLFHFVAAGIVDLSHLVTDPEVVGVVGLSAG